MTPLKFLADECCDAGLIHSLRAEGHDVSYVLEEKTGIRDETVLQNPTFLDRFEKNRFIKVFEFMMR